MKCRDVCASRHAEQSWNLAGTRNGGRRYRGTIGSVRRLLTLGQPHRNTAIQAHLQDRRPLALVVTLVLCLVAFVLSSNEAWAKEQPSSTEQQPPPPTTGESTTTIVNGGNQQQEVAEPAPTAPTAPPPPVVTTPPPVVVVEAPPTETLT